MMNHTLAQKIGILAGFVVLVVVFGPLGTHATTAPPPPGIPDLIAPSDTGSSSTDNTTEDTTPTFLISCESGDTVTLYQGLVTPVQIGTGACGTDSVLVESDPLSGTYTITATQTSIDGTSDPSGGLEVGIAALPTLDDAELHNNTATTVKILVDGNNFGKFGSSGTDTADSTDVKNILYDGAHPYSAEINNATTVQLNFNITDIGTGKSGGPITFTSGTLANGGADAAGALSIADGDITDSAKPVLIGFSCGFNSDHTKVNGCDLLMSEPLHNFADAANANFTASTSANLALTINDADIVITDSYPGNSEVGIYFDTSDINNDGAASLSFGYVSGNGGSVIEDLASIPNETADFGTAAGLTEVSPPVITITAPDTTGTTSITTTTVHVNDPNGIASSDVIADVNGTVEFNNFNCSQTDSDNVDCTVNITSSGTFRVRATDDLGNVNQAQVDGYDIVRNGINTCKQLQNMNADTGGVYTLGDGIDCADASTGNDSSLWNVVDGVPQGFAPVNGFGGSLDANDYTITGLYINRPLDNNVALFGSTTNGFDVHDITMSNATVVGHDDAAALVGVFQGGGNVSHISIDHTTVTGSGQQTGALVGDFSSAANMATLSYVTVASSVTVSGINYVGGMAGEIDTNQNSIFIEHNTSDAVVTVPAGVPVHYIGGLIGGLYPYGTGTTTLSDVHSSANVDTSAFCPGDGCFAAGGDPDATFNGDYIGGLVADLQDGQAVFNASNATSSGTIIGHHYIGGSIGYLKNYDDCGGGGCPPTMTLDDMHATGNVIGFQNAIGGLIGRLDANDAATTLSNSDASGAVTDSGIASDAIGGLIGQVLLDVDCSACNTADSLDFDTDSASGAVTGVDEFGGLIGQMVNNEGTITVEHSFASGNLTGTGGATFVGGLVGYIDNTGGQSVTFDDDYASGNLSGQSGSALFDAGGLVGFSNTRESNSTTTIGDSYATGNITGNTISSQLGGLIGTIAAPSNTGGATTLSDVHADGNIVGNNSAGGLVGEIDGDSGSTISLGNTYAIGTVTLSGSNPHNAGGLIGLMNADDGVLSVTQSYATGDVLGYGHATEIGGLIGYAVNVITVSESYASGIASGSGDIGGFIGFSNLSGTRISDSYATGEVRASGNGSEIGGFLGGGSLKLGRVYATGAVTTNAQYVGGLVGELDSVLASDSFSVGPVVAPQNIQTAGLIGYVGGGETLTNNFYDKDSSLQADCAHDSSDILITDGCTAITGQANYFKANHTNAPLNHWSTDIWNFASGYPRLVAFVGAGPTPTPTPIPTPTPTPSPHSVSGTHINPTPNPTAGITPASRGFTTLAAIGLTEGDTLSAVVGDPDIYIPNIYGYKRLFLNPIIFSFYGHLGGFSAVKRVPAVARDTMVTSGLFRNCETDDQKVYGVQIIGEDTGMLHWVNTSGAQAVTDDPDFFKKVFCINTNEFNWYPKGSDYTSVNQIPLYSR